jgi:CBS domain-containing protein
MVDDAKRVPKKHHGSHIDKIMIPASKLKVAYPQQSAASVLGIMDEQGIDHMPVIEDDKIVGLISRERLVRLAQIRNKLKI